MSTNSLFNSNCANVYSNSTNYNNNSCYNTNSQLKIAEIEAKMAQHEMDYIENNKILKERIKQYIINESEMKRELINTTSAYSDLKNQIDDIYKENQYLKDQCCEFEEKYIKVSKDFEYLKYQYDNMINNINNYNKENVFNEKFQQSLNNIKQRDSEIQRLNLLIRKYCAELEEKNIQITIYQKENDNYKGEISSNEAQKKKNYEEINILSKEKEQLKKENINLKEKIKSLEDISNQREFDIKQLQTEKFTLSQKITTLQVEINELREKNKSLNKEKDKLVEFKNNIDKTEFTFNSDIIKLKADISNIITISSDNITSISYWINNYLCNLFSPNVELPEININNSLNEILNFEDIKKALIISKNKIDAELSSSLTQIKELKTILTKGQDDNYKLNKYIEDIYHYILNEIEINRLFNPNIYKYKMESSPVNEIEEMLKKIFDILKKAKLSQDVEYLQKLLEDNMTLNNDLNNEKAQNEKLYNETITLNKKNKYLLQEIDLKNAQITTQSEIIDRRNITEEDNQKLVKDNITLLSQLNSLKKGNHNYKIKKKK